MAFNGVGVAIDKRFGARIALTIGLVLLAAGFGLLAAMSPGDGYVRLVVALVVMGAGSGTAGPAAYGTLLAALPPERAGVGSAVNDTVQQVGQALSVAILGSVLTAAYSAPMPKGVTGPALHRRGTGHRGGLPRCRAGADRQRRLRRRDVEHRRRGRVRWHRGRRGRLHGAAPALPYDCRDQRRTGQRDQRALNSRPSGVALEPDQAPRRAQDPWWVGVWVCVGEVP
jgi:hypothetical protein